MKIPVGALALAGALLLAGPVHAQTIGYAQAIDQIAKGCKADIAKSCRRASLGGGSLIQCLGSSGSGACRTQVQSLATLLRTRAAARGALRRTCDPDIRRICNGVVEGDGNLLECFTKARNSISAPCVKTVTDAGYDVGLAQPGGTRAPIKFSSAKLVETLQAAEATPVINAARLRQMAADAINDPARSNPVNRAPLTGELENLAQFTIAVEFDFASANIRPDSFRAVGLMADSLYHPYLLGYRFLVVGHTDAVGDRASNLRLSQQRAEAIRAALINPFGIDPARIEAVGLGEEQLLEPANPQAAKNRRVQLINIGK